jgi:hypothetical protein
MVGSSAIEKVEHFLVNFLENWSFAPSNEFQLLLGLFIQAFHSIMKQINVLAK